MGGGDGMFGGVDSGNRSSLMVVRQIKLNLDMMGNILVKPYFITKKAFHPRPPFYKSWDLSHETRHMRLEILDKMYEI